MSFTVKHVVRLLLVLIVGTLAINFWIGLNNKNVNESNNVADYIWNNQTVTKKENVMFNALEGTTDVLMKPIEFGKAYGELPTATKDGYLFDGWYTEKDGGNKVTADTIVVNDNLHILYAHYKEDPDIIARIETLEAKSVPIGFVFQSTSNINPSSTMGGSWQLIASGKTLVGYDKDDDDFAKVRNTGGEKEHTLTIAEMPIHGHTGSTTTNSYNHNHKINYTNTPKADGSINGGLSPSAWNVGADSYWGSASTNAIPVYNENEQSMTNGSDSGSHSHSFTTSSTGGNRAHNNLMPYCVVYTWEKIAM